MTITKEELNKFITTLSIERLLSFKQDNNDTVDMLIERYKNNIKISQALYPELSILEVTLRNAIDTMLKTCISQTWLEDEIKQQKILSSQEYAKLVRAYNDTKESYPNNFTIGKVIANLNLGFWTGLCSKKYNSVIWTKKKTFKGVFINYPANLKERIHPISIKLNSIRKLRNRIFHHEPILSNTLLNKYNEIMEVLSYLPCDNSNILKETSNFLEVYNKVSKTIYTPK
ncbi:MAG: hypothetical protein NC200_07305 [Candidatus Gastranaerophilales bacterium]|nr:hypothetical protein [Candidatus Gastranaerophilales bacterium]